MPDTYSEGATEGYVEIIAMAADLDERLSLLQLLRSTLRRAS